MSVWSLSRENLLEEEIATYSVFLPGESHGERRRVGTWDRKESDTTKYTHTFIITKRWKETDVHQQTNG